MGSSLFRTARLLAALLPVLLAPPSSRAGDAAAREWHGAHGGPAAFQLVVCRGETAWRALWTLAGRDPPAGFDDKADMAVGIFLGLRNTGGYDVEIRSVATENSYVAVTYAEHKPGPGAIVTQALTTPYVIRVLPRSDLPVVFRPAADGTGLNQIPDDELRRLVERTDELAADKDQLTAAVAAAAQRLREFEELLERLRRALPGDGVRPQ